MRASDVKEAVEGQGKTVLVMAGGTGGHIFPALATAKKLKSMGYQVHWLGTRHGIENELIPDEDFPLTKITVTGLRGKGLLHWMVAPFKLFYSFLLIVRLLYRIKPVVVLGMGGYVSAAGGFAAWVCRYPLVIHEQNAIPGLTNRCLSRFAKVVLEAFPNSFSNQKKVICTGNPIREVISNIPQPEKRNLAKGEVLKVLVLGGSLGAKSLNEIVPRALSSLASNEQPQVWHQAGKTHFAMTKVAYERVQIEPYRIEAFISNIQDALLWADLVICRSGAITVSEIAAAGLGSILVPFPYAVDDHQTANGQYLNQAGAAIIIQERQLNSTKLAKLLSDLNKDRERVIDMAHAARQLARPEATDKVANLCIEVSSND